MLVVLLGLVGCQAPFGEARQRLAGDRVAAITLSHEADGVVRPAAWTVVEGRPWADEPPELMWSWLPDGVSPDTPPAAPVVGAWPALTRPATASVPRLRLEARFASGEVSIAVIDVPEAGLPPLDGLDLALLPGRPLADATETELARDARLAEPAEPADAVPVGTWARLAVRSPPPDGTRVRWMATAGTVLELDATSTDWAPADLVLDDLDVEEATPLESGVVTVLALAVDGRGGNVAAARDVPVGRPGAGMPVSGRWLPGDGLSPETVGWFRGRLAADDASPTGLRLDDATPVDPPAGAYGTETLACAGPTPGPFDPTWLLDGRCTRADVVGADVVVAHAW
jgi:hypothetical protein